jgi:hypothetical protein
MGTRYRQKENTDIIQSAGSQECLITGILTTGIQAVRIN